MALWISNRISTLNLMSKSFKRLLNNVELHLKMFLLKTSSDDCVQQMCGLYEGMAAGMEQGMVHGKTLDILREQKMSMIQFESCLDECNRYLTALKLLDTMMQSVYACV